jgi:hypothetical protein
MIDCCFGCLGHLVWIHTASRCIPPDWFSTEAKYYNNDVGSEEGSRSLWIKIYPGYIYKAIIMMDVEVNQHSGFITSSSRYQCAFDKVCIPGSNF